jgi:hypothetical protein
MGLDVHLYKYEDHDAATKAWEAVEAETNRIWKEVCGDGAYDSIPEEKKKKYRALAKEAHLKLGFIETEYYYSAQGETQVELNSTKYPDHLFKVGYFRSSYNDGGIDRVLETSIGETLYTLFNVTNDTPYEFQPDWNHARANVVAAIEKFKTYLATKGAYRAYKVERNMFSNENGPTSEKEALDIFHKCLESHKDDKSEFGGSFTNKDGDFSLMEPVKVFAMIPGTDTVLGERDCVWVVYKNNYMDSYLVSLEIVLETCDYVLASGEVEKFWLRWSA